MTHGGKLLTLLTLLNATAILGQTAAEPDNWVRGLAPGEDSTDTRNVALHYRVGLGGEEFLDPSGLEAHLVATERPNIELVVPAGVFFDAPPGNYRVWLEGNWRISPVPSRFPTIGDPPLGGPRVAFLQTVQAGKVTIDNAPASPRNLSVRLLKLGAALEGGYVRNEFDRQAPAAEMGRGLLMPVGQVIAMVLDNKTKNVVNLSRPFGVGAEITTKVPILVSSSVAQLLVRVERDRTALEPGDLHERFVLRQDGIEIGPTATALGASRFYSIWNDLKPGPADLEIEWEGKYLDSPVELRGGEVTSIEGSLKTRPSLTLDLVLPASISSERAVASIASRSTGRSVREVRFREGGGKSRVVELPAIPLSIILATSLGSLSAEVDLSSGEDQYLLLEPSFQRVFGTVRRGSDRAQAELTFRVQGSLKLDVETNDQGEYEVVTTRPLAGVSIQLAGSKQAPWVEFFSKPVAETQELDFTIPSAIYKVHVLESSTRRPIPGASVAVRNSYDERELNRGGLGGDEDQRKSPPKRAVGQNVTADEYGTAVLPPLRLGAIEVDVSAKGFRPMQESLKRVVPDESTDQELEVLLEAEGATATVSLSLPDGSPAAGAEVMLVDELSSAQVLFSGTTNESGELEVPRNFTSAVLLARHPQAAYLVTSWNPTDEESRYVLQMPATSGRTLFVRVLRSLSDDPFPAADVGLRLGQSRFFGALLMWLVRSHPDEAAYWAIENLPASEVSLLAWGPAREGEAISGGLSTLETAVPWPWPQVVALKAIE